MVRHSRDYKAVRVLGQIDRKLSQVLTVLSRNQHSFGVSGFDGRGSLTMSELLAMPDHVRKTAVTLGKLGRATSGMVSRKTGRVRSQESVYLNDLVMMGLARRERQGRKVYFYIPRRRPHGLASL